MGPKDIDNDDWIGHPLELSGWGYTNQTMKEKSILPDILQHATLTIWDSKKCFEDWCHSQIALPSNWNTQKKVGFCAKGRHEEIGCQGDSGGAAIWKDVEDQNRAYVIGLQSRMD